MQYQAIIIGEAFYIEEEGREVAVISANFQESINEIPYIHDADFQYLGSVNVAEANSEHVPFHGTLAYDSSLKYVDQNFRQRFPKSGTSSLLKVPTYPTVIFLTDEAREPIAVIKIQSGSWSSAHFRFKQDLDFFIEPAIADIQKDLRTNNPNIIEIPQGMKTVLADLKINH